METGLKGFRVWASACFGAWCSGVVGLGRLVHRPSGQGLTGSIQGSGVLTPDAPEPSKQALQPLHVAHRSPNLAGTQAIFRKRGLHNLNRVCGICVLNCRSEVEGTVFMLNSSQANIHRLNASVLSFV